MEGDVVERVKAATVFFTDGTMATFSAIEILPGGVLKATLVEGCHPHGHNVTDIAYYGVGVWRSVQGPRTGALMLRIGGESDLCLEVGITEQEVSERIEKELQARRVPEEEHRAAHAMDDFNLSRQRIARFEMEWPHDSHNRPLEQRRAARKP